MTAVASPGAGGGHPVWHLLVVAIGSAGVFAGIKAWEWWRAYELGHRPHAAPARHRERPPWSWPSRPLIVALALASAGGAAVHAAVGPDHFREATAFGVFFVTASALQGAWALLVIRRCSRALLMIGTVGNGAVLAL
jgi:hypothetical protein